MKPPPGVRLDTRGGRKAAPSSFVATRFTLRPMNLLGLGILLLIVGIVLWAAAIAAHLGWVLLVVGIVLIVVSFVFEAAGGLRWPRR